MPAIGYVKKTQNGYEGHLKTLTISAPIVFIPVADKTNEAQPDYRIMTGQVEIGAAWNRVSQSTGNDYVSVTFAAPEFGRSRMYANLGVAAGQDDPDTFAIIWNPAEG